MSVKSFSDEWDRDGFLEFSHQLENYISDATDDIIQFLTNVTSRGYELEYEEFFEQRISDNAIDTMMETSLVFERDIVPIAGGTAKDVVSIRWKDFLWVDVCTHSLSANWLAIISSENRCFVEDYSPPKEKDGQEEQDTWLGSMLDITSIVTGMLQRERIFVMAAVPVTSEIPPKNIILTRLEKQILNALSGKAMTGQQLADAVKCERTRLYKGPLERLKTERLVSHQHNVGYYCVDSPPEDLTVNREGSN